MIYQIEVGLPKQPLSNLEMIRESGITIEIFSLVDTLTRLTFGITKTTKLNLTKLLYLEVYIIVIVYLLYWD